SHKGSGPRSTRYLHEGRGTDESTGGRPSLRKGADYQSDVGYLVYHVGALCESRPKRLATLVVSIIDIVLDCHAIRQAGVLLSTRPLGLTRVTPAPACGVADLGPITAALAITAITAIPPLLPPLPPLPP